MGFFLQTRGKTTELDNSCPLIKLIKLLTDRKSNPKTPNMNNILFYLSIYLRLEKATGIGPTVLWLIHIFHEVRCNESVINIV